MAPSGGRCSKTSQQARQRNHCYAQIDVDGLALQAIASAVNGFQGEVKVISRTGGEEFEVVVDQLDEPAVFALADRIRLVIASIDLGENRQLTASLGIALRWRWRAG